MTKKKKQKNTKKKKHSFFLRFRRFVLLRHTMHNTRWLGARFVTAVRIFLKKGKKSKMKTSTFGKKEKIDVFKTRKKVPYKMKVSPRTCGCWTILQSGIKKINLNLFQKA